MVRVELGRSSASTAKGGEGLATRVLVSFGVAVSHLLTLEMRSMLDGNGGVFDGKSNFVTASKRGGEQEGRGGECRLRVARVRQFLPARFLNHLRALTNPSEKPAQQHSP